MISPLQAALAYAQELHWYVFPVNTDKTPLTKNGLKDASIDPSIITGWWTKYPEAGVAVVTGEISNLVVLDLDLKLDRDITVEGSLAEIISKFGNIPETASSQTGGGGRHIFFLPPAGEKIRSSVGYQGIPGVDIRGESSYVVVPPSNHLSGNNYLWLNDPWITPLAVAPAFMLLKKKKLKLNINQDTPEKVAAGGRNVKLTSLAGLMRSLGLEYAELFLVLKSVNLTKCEPPLEESEVETIAKSVSNYPPVRTNESEPVTPETLQYLLGFTHSDVGASDMFAAYCKDKVKYNYNIDQWLVWSGEYWSPDQSGKIQRLAIEITREYRRAIINVTDPETRESLFKYATKLESAYSLRTMVELSKSRTEISTVIDQWNNDDYLFGTENGYIDLTTGEFKPGDPSKLISMSNKINYDTTAQCPRWIQFLDEIFENNQEVINYVQRSLGYSLTGDTKEQCLFLLVGSGGNGKSIFLETIRGVLGDYGAVAPFSTFEKSAITSSNTNDIARLNGKRLVTASETDENAPFNEARIKSLTGSEEQVARFLNHEFFSFKPKLKIWLALNNPPKIKDTSDAMASRLRRIDFPMKFRGTDKQDTELDKKLKNELPGILNWCIQGSLLYQRDGLKSPEIVITATNKYIENSDPLVNYFIDICSTKENEKTLVDTAYKIYRSWAESRGFKPYSVLTLDKFLIRMEKHYPRVEDEGKKYFNNLLITEEIKKQYSQTQGIVINRGKK